MRLAFFSVKSYGYGYVWLRMVKFTFAAQIRSSNKKLK